MPSDFRERLIDKYYSTHYIHFTPQNAEGWAWVLERLRMNFGGIFSSLSRESRILDVPCGVGYLPHYLLREGFHKIDCVDLSEEQIAVAKQKLAEFGLDFNGRVQFVVADAFTYLEKADPYDLIAIIDFVEHLKKDEVGELLTVARSALRPDGLLLLRTSNADTPMFSKYFYTDFTHETPFTPNSIRQCLEAAGFKVEKIQYEQVGRMESTLMGRLKAETRLRVLAKLLGIPHAAFAEDLIAVARK